MTQCQPNSDPGHGAELLLAWGLGLSIRRRHRPRRMAAELSIIRLSARTTLGPGERFRAIGGPVHRTSTGTSRIGHPGVYECRRLFEKSGRVFVDALRIDARGFPAGRYTLFISGKPFRSPLVPTIVNRPYRVRKVRAPR